MTERYNIQATVNYPDGGEEDMVFDHDLDVDQIKMWIGTLLDHEPITSATSYQIIIVRN